MTAKKKIAIGVGSFVVLCFASLYILDFLSHFTNKTEGSFGQSETRTEAISNDLFVIDYEPSKDTIVLLDNRKVILGNAWAETIWSYRDRQPNIAEYFGYNLQLEFTGDNADFVFTFDLLDKENQSFTNGIGRDKCVFNPTELRDTIEIIVEEKNPEQDIGWMKPIVTDTIKLMRKK